MKGITGGKDDELIGKLDLQVNFAKNKSPLEAAKDLPCATTNSSTTFAHEVSVDRNVIAGNYHRKRSVHPDLSHRILYGQESSAALDTGIQSGKSTAQFRSVNTHHHIHGQRNRKPTFCSGWRSNQARKTSNQLSFLPGTPTPRVCKSAATNVELQISTIDPCKEAVESMLKELGALTSQLSHLKHVTQSHIRSCDRIASVKDMIAIVADCVDGIRQSTEKIATEEAALRFEPPANKKDEVVRHLLDLIKNSLPRLNQNITICCEKVKEISLMWPGDQEALIVDESVHRDDQIRNKTVCGTRQTCVPKANQNIKVFAFRSLADKWVSLQSTAEKMKQLADHFALRIEHLNHSVHENSALQTRIAQLEGIITHMTVEKRETKHQIKILAEEKEKLQEEVRALSRKLQKSRLENLQSEKASIELQMKTPHKKLRKQLGSIEKQCQVPSAPTKSEVLSHNIGSCGQSSCAENSLDTDLQDDCGPQAQRGYTSTSHMQKRKHHHTNNLAHQILSPVSSLVARDRLLQYLNENLSHHRLVIR